MTWLTIFSTIESAVQSGKSKCALRVEATNAHVGSGASEAVGAVANATKSSRFEAAATLKTAKDLDEGSATAMSLSDCEISYGQARDIAAAAAVDPSSESALLAFANHDSLRARQERARRIKAAQAGRTDCETAYKSRYLSFKPAGKYTTDIYGRLLNADVAKIQAVRGCDLSVGLELDHRQGVAAKGKSRHLNLAYLCKWHHYLKTNLGYTLRGPTGDYELIPPDTGDVNQPLLI